MELPANTYKVGAYAYLIESPAGADVTDCYISAHGGDASFLADGYYSINDVITEFTVPAGCTVFFFANKNEAHVSRGGRVASLKAIATENLTVGAQPTIKQENTFTENQKCVDYVLGKNLGVHGDNEQYTDFSDALAELAGDAGDGMIALKWLPHFVTVRNRTAPWRHKSLFLSHLISDIRKSFPHIVNFFCANCRTRLYHTETKKAQRKAGKQAYQS